MTINNFKDNISEVILERGLRYFENGRVSYIEEIEDGSWDAEVMGTENYQVNVVCNDTSISNWDCDCPYEDGPVCKHVVAVLYAISEKSKLTKQTSKAKSNKRKTFSKKIEAVFGKISKEDLQKFLLTQFSKDRNLRNSFIANFAELIDEKNPAEKYQTIIDNIYNSALDRSGWVDYRNSCILGGALIELAEKADNCLAKNNRTECIIICKVLIENVTEFLNSVDDSSGLLSEALNNSFATLGDVIAQSPPVLKDDLFEYCITEYQKKKYRDIGVDDEFLNLLPELITTDEQEKIFLDILDKRLSIEIENDNYQYNCVRIISAKVDYYRNKEKFEEAKKIIRDNINYSEFRNIVVDEHIANKEYLQAKKMCLDGMKIAEDKNRLGTVGDWMKKLLQISQIERNIPDIRKWSEKLYFKYGRDMSYYKILKQTYSDKEIEWTKECERILEKIGYGDLSKRFYSHDSAAEIFIEENYLDRLLELIQNSQNDIRFVDKFAENIKDKYPKELTEAYSSAIKKHAKTTDKRIYKEVVKYMKNLNKVKGSDDEVKKLLDYFRVTYRNRKSMMEILNKNFSG